jgi:hypothetical protein
VCTGGVNHVLVTDRGLNWERTDRNGQLLGHDTTAAGATVLGIGRHLVETIKGVDDIVRVSRGTRGRTQSVVEILHIDARGFENNRGRQRRSVVYAFVELLLHVGMPQRASHTDRSGTI